MAAQAAFFMIFSVFRDSNPVKSSVSIIFEEKQMAIHQNPDRDVNYMRENWGTTRLITDYRSENSVTPTKTAKNNPPENRLDKPCGGKDGFDDYVEWWV